jgi:3-deoxy-D-manno-octulosonic-acid transferase
MLLGLYRGLMQLGGPALGLMLARRAAFGKEDQDRSGERRGIPSKPRPSGSLVWCHAASVGESLSLLPLIERLVPRTTVLVTTGTTTSAVVMAARLPAGAIHQYVPVDRPSWVRAFYDHWQPDLALWVESELWPNLVAELQRRQIPAALVNGRMSAQSFGRWRRVPGIARSLLGAFDVVLAQTGPDSERLAALGAAGAKAVGNLKFSAAPLPDLPERRAAFQQAQGLRPCWIMASTHPGEEEIAADIHSKLQRRLPGLLTVMAPRHPERGSEIEAVLRARELALVRRTANWRPQPD